MSIRDSLTAVPALHDNYIWLLEGRDRRCVIVDPGAAAPVREALGAAGLRASAILLTHHHHDHTGGVAELAEALGVPVYGPEEPRLEADVRVGAGDQVQLAGAGLEFTVIAVPGHTRSHIAWFGHGVAFTGDALFSLGCGRIFEGTPAQMLASLDRLAALPGDTLVCCAHEYTLANAAFAQAVEPDNQALQARLREATAQRQAGAPTLPVTLASELACNPFLRCDQPAVAAAAVRRDGVDPADRVAVFTSLRAWKDGFTAP